mgnify:CR=1 FL=1
MKLKRKDLICISLILLLIYVVFERNDKIPEPFTFNAYVNVAEFREGATNMKKNQKQLMGSVTKKKMKARDLSQTVPDLHSKGNLT